jgi:hypothetical protein
MYVFSEWMDGPVSLRAGRPAPDTLAQSRATHPSFDTRRRGPFHRPAREANGWSEGARAGAVRSSGPPPGRDPFTPAVRQRSTRSSSLA